MRLIGRLRLGCADCAFCAVLHFGEDSTKSFSHAHRPKSVKGQVCALFDFQKMERLVFHRLKSFIRIPQQKL